MIIPAASGIAECANLDPAQRQRLVSALESLESRFDYILIDTAAGIGDTVLYFVQSAQYAIVVISTEPTSLTDAFALLRVLKRRNYGHPVYVLVNMALNYANSMEVFKRFEAAVKKYLNMKIHYLGYITEDKAIRSSVSAQRPVLLQHPEALASRCFTTLATVLSKQFSGTPSPHSFSAYWSGLAAAPTPPGAPSAQPSSSSPPGGVPTVATDQAWSQVRERIQDTAIPEAEVTQRLTTLLQAYVARFHRLPLDRPDLLQPLLEERDYPAAEQHGLTARLDALFERHQSEMTRPAESAHTASPEQDRILLEYRRAAERIQAEETLLHQALNRLYEYINRELVPAGAVSSQPPEERAYRDMEVKADSHLPDHGPG
jgi:flagellar biosynthesis protein FlhG